VTLAEGAGDAALVTRYLILLSTDGTVWAIRLQAPLAQWPASEATLDAILASVAFQAPGVAVSQTPDPRNITLEGFVGASSTFSSSFLASRAVDNDTGTSWFSSGPGPNGTSTFTWEAREDFHITRVEIFGNGLHDNPSFRLSFGFRTVEVRLLDATGNLVVSQTGSGLGGDTFTFNDTARTVQLVFSGHQSTTCGGFAELDVFGYEPQTAVEPPPDDPGQGEDPAAQELADLIDSLDERDRDAYNANIQDFALDLTADQAGQFLLARRSAEDAMLETLDQWASAVSEQVVDSYGGESHIRQRIAAIARGVGYAAVDNANGSSRFPIMLALFPGDRALTKIRPDSTEALIDLLLLVDPNPQASS